MVAEENTSADYLRRRWWWWSGCYRSGDGSIEDCHCRELTGEEEEEKHDTAPMQV